MISRLSTRAPPLEAATVPIKNESLYTTFMVYFMDYRPPNIFTQRTIKINEEKRKIYDQVRLGDYTTPFLHLSYKGKNVLGNNQTFEKLFLKK
jgi:hypothetical protein